MQQSTSPVLLPPNTTIPIYCVVSGHSLYDDYKWDCVDRIVPGNTPVLWVNVPGVYRCRITRGGQVCSSAVIIVELPTYSEEGIMILYNFKSQ